MNMSLNFNNIFKWEGLVNIKWDILLGTPTMLWLNAYWKSFHIQFVILQHPSFDI
jgi:hypothetical protein